MTKIKPINFSESRWVPWIMAAADILTLEIAVLIGLWARFLLKPIAPIGLGPDTFVGVMIAVPIVSVTYLLLGIYPGYGLNPIERFRKRLVVLFSVFPAMVAWDYIFQDGQWSRGVLILTFFAAILLVPLVEFILISFLMRLGKWGTPAIIVGVGYTNEGVIDLLRSQPKLGFVPVAYFDNENEHWDENWNGLPVLGNVSQSKLLSESVDTAIISLSEEHSYYLSAISEELEFKKIVIVPDLGSIQSLWVTARDLGGIVGLEIKQNLLIQHNRVIKRTLDIIIGGIAWILSLPIVLICAALIKIISPGPAFYAQVREGFQGEELKVWKLRSMRPDAEAVLEGYLEKNPEAREEWEKYFKLKEDPRIIPVIGNVMRRWSLDELPQLLGVLQGRLSLVGPRPFPDYHLEKFDPIFRNMRRNVRPGLTGLWQITSRSSGAIENQEVLDSYYIQNWSLWVDFYILVRTTTAVILAKNAH